jgi:hypothetical protein
MIDYTSNFLVDNQSDKWLDNIDYPCCGTGKMLTRTGVLTRLTIFLFIYLPIP